MIFSIHQEKPNSILKNSHWINNSTLTDASNFGVGVLLYVCVLQKKKKPMCGLCPISPSLLGVCEYINNSATLTAASSFGVGVLLYVCVLKKKKRKNLC